MKKTDKHPVPHWLTICMAYEEAAEHLEVCASQESEPEEKAAYFLVAKRIRKAADRVRAKK